MSMADGTKIEWTDASWNVVTGCDRISPGCDNCYALTLAARLKRMGSANYQTDGDPQTSGPGFGVQCHPDMLDQPLRWKRPRRIFVNSMSDMFHKDVPLSFINDVWEVMAQCPQHTFQILTKRSKRMRQLLAGEQHGMDLIPHVGHWKPLPNVWLGVSIENDQYTFRADHLRSTPAAVRFISAEPLIGPLPSLDLTGIDWVITGGESGPGARPMHPDWVRDIRDRCLDRCEPCEIPDVPKPHSVYVPGGGRTCLCEYPDPVPFHFKQWGNWAPVSPEPIWGNGTIAVPGGVFRHRLGIKPRHGEITMVNTRKKAAGRELDGRTWDQFPKAAVAA